MPTHEYFRELAALAEVGEISEKEHSELQIHLRDCPECRHAAHEYRELLFDWLPLGRPAELEGDLRPNIRSFRIRTGWIMPIAALLVLAVAISLFWAVRSWKESVKLSKAVEASRLENASLRRRTEEKDRRFQALEESLAHPDRAVTAPAERDPGEPKALEEARARVAQLQAERDGLKAAYSDVREEQDRLSRELEQAKAAHQVEQNRSSELQSRARNLETQVAERETQIKGLKSRLAFLDARIKAENEPDRNSSGKLDELLHDPSLQVINVYAVSNKSRKPNVFCRILKVADAPSMIYVYRLTTGDFGLPDDRRHFQVLGMKLSMEPDSLGLLNPAQVVASSVQLGELKREKTSSDRWVLELSDSKVLNDIRYLLITERPPRSDSAVSPVFWGYLAR